MLCNDVGLLAEEYDPMRAECWATFHERSAMSGTSTQRSTSIAPRDPPEHAAAPDISSILPREYDVRVRPSELFLRRFLVLRLSKPAIHCLHAEALPAHFMRFPLSRIG
jgi:hypothetical protein